jgi:mannose-6-phosphate isomerase-like protein (cupin superfamily)
MKPLTKLSDILADHKGLKNWKATVVNDVFLHADYIQMAPGEMTLRRAHPDTREWWVIQDGAIRFTIDGVEPFVATKGCLVQVPYRTFYSMETVGDKPSLRFEVNIAGATPIPAPAASSIFRCVRSAAIYLRSRPAFKELCLFTARPP